MVKTLKMLMVFVFIFVVAIESNAAQNIVYVSDFGEPANGVTLQAAIDSIQPDNANIEIVFPAGIVVNVSKTLILKSRIKVNLNGSTLRWNGDTGGVIVSNSTNDLLYQAGLYNGNIAPRNAQVILDLHSPNNSIFKDLQIIRLPVETEDPESTVLTEHTGLVVLRVRADADNNNGFRNVNAVANIFENIGSDKIVDINTGVWLEGYADCTKEQIQKGTCYNKIKIVTLNHFKDFHFPSVTGIAYKLVAWTDNNYFTGIHRHNLKASGAKGVVHNASNAPDSETGVYANHFEHLACDNFDDNISDRACVTFNKTKNNIISALFWSSNTWGKNGNVLIDDNYNSSYMITVVGENGKIVTKTNNTESVPGGQVWLDSRTLIPTNLLGTGSANSYSYLRGDGTWQTLPGSNAIELQGNSVSSAPPSDKNCLIWNQSSNQWEPSPCLNGMSRTVSNPNPSDDKRVVRFSSSSGTVVNNSLIEINDLGDINKKASTSLRIGGDASSNSTGIILGKPITVGSDNKALIQTQVTAQPTANIIGALYGWSIIPTISNSDKSVNYLRPVYVRGDTQENFTGNISNLQNIVIDNPAKSGGSITNLYGLYINKLDAGSGSNWSIVTDSSPNLFGGNTIIGPLGDLSTNATDGYLYIPTMLGRPQSTPTNYGGKSPIVHNRTNNAEELCIYSSTSAKWVCTSLK